MIPGEPVGLSACMCADVVILPLRHNQRWSWIQLICSGHLLFFQKYKQKQTHEVNDLLFIQ